MLKKVLIFAMPFVIFLILGFSNTPANASFKEDSISNQIVEQYKQELSNLSSDEVIEYFERINREYAIGEEFSLKDQTFIKMYADKTVKNTNTLSTKSAVTKSSGDSKYISDSKTSNGITVSVKGYIISDIQNIINQSFGASNLKTSTTQGASKVTSVKTVVNHDAYGLVGSGGIGKVYSGSISTTGLNTTLNSTKKYTGIVAYASTWCTVTVKYSGGSFTINPS